MLKELEAAVSKQDAEATRDTLLKLAQQIWPEILPVSLAQMSRLTQGALADELLNLERSLYAVEQTSWDGALILREMSSLKPEKHSARTQQPALQPMYPSSILG